ncbi:MAG: hypothetical protein NXI10_10805 [bacterium]|nr:hypothetical protein [bacterium]
MKKILILAYFYPPSVFVGGQRIEFWAKHLHEFGYYPVIVTRNWNEGQTTLTEEVHNNDLKVETHETHEVHRLPFHRSTRDKLADKQGMKLFQKAFTFWELIASNFSIKALPYSNMLPYCDQLLASGEFEAFIASGRPFQTFQIGHILKKKHDIQWIPDYRDEWNSHYRTSIRNPLMKLIAFLERKSEKKWVSNADVFLSVSDIWVNRISNFTGLEGKVVKNGFDEIVPKQIRNDQQLKILYAGTLYPYQDIRPITEAIAAIDHPNLRFFFIGNCESEENWNYLKDLEKKKPQTFQIVEKIPKVEFEKLIPKMDIGIMTPYQNLTGCLPVKIFDYYANGLQLLLCPSDEDLMVNFISETESGITVNSQQECEDYLKEQLKAKQEGAFDRPRNYILGKEYHRLYQTEVLAKTLDIIIKDPKDQS